MRWNVGRVEIEEALGLGRLERVPPSRERADLLLEQARLHLRTARTGAEDDPSGAFTLVYDAARKALWALLANEGLRPTREGGHLAAYHAVQAQLANSAPEEAVRPFDAMRRTRNRSEYPSREVPATTTDDVLETLLKAETIIQVVEALLDNMSPF